MFEREIEKGKPIWIEGKKHIITFVAKNNARFSMVAYEEKEVENASKN